MYYELLQGRLAPTASRRHLAQALEGGALGAWTATTGMELPRLVVLQAWPTFAAREAAVQARSDAIGRLERGLLLRHEVSMLGPCNAWALARREVPLPPAPIYELRTQRVLNGFHTDAGKVLGESTLPLLQSLGAQVLGVFDLLLGARRPTIATFLAWPDLATQQHAWERLHVEPRFWRRRDEERTRYRRRLFGDETSHLLQALPGLAPQANFGIRS